MSYIQAYNAKPSLVFKGKSPYGIYFGVEIEVEVKDDEFDKESKARDVTEKVNKFAIIKHDGSLRYGFEICSSPATYDFHSYAWDKFFNGEVLEGLRAFGTKTAGMHVHISREPLSSLQIGKMISFIHNPLNSKFVKRIAQRESNRYNDFSKSKKVSAAHDKFLLNEARYTAVNLVNKNTVEIRIFKSNLRKDSFLRNLEFCAALVEFTWPSRYSIQQAQSWKYFAIFVIKNRKTYPHLYSYLVRNKYIIIKRHNIYSELNLAKAAAEKEKIQEVEKKLNPNPDENYFDTSSWMGGQYISKNEEKERMNKFSYVHKKVRDMKLK